ncbi:MAG: alpha-galactosidase [Bellilinea sp.]|jgi:alpha-galactosidase
MPPEMIALSTSRLGCVLRAENGKLHLERLDGGGNAWLHPRAISPLFTVMVDGTRCDARSLTLVERRENRDTPGMRQHTFRFQNARLTVEQRLCVYEDEALLEAGLVVTNRADKPQRIERIDSLALNLAPLAAELFSFTGNWGSEFEPQHRRLQGEIVLESRSGRSSKGNHPWFALTAEPGAVLSAAIAWSGNWVMRFQPLPEGGVCLSGGIHDWEFSKTLQPGESVEGAPFILVVGEDLNAVSQQYARVGRRYWYPYSPFAAGLPVEWNHWWPYEDAEINQQVFLANVERAAEMGFEVCTLDAGWFGPSDASTFWEHYRGDWALVNRQRFPDGPRTLADAAHARGMKFGMWCEIEALGERAQLAQDRPDFVARRDGKPLGCVCFGNPQVQEWAHGILKRLVEEYGCDWIKVDFNLDPGAGCNREDHGHQRGDGLYEHYRGYYRTLERLRREYPALVLENCSSGGLRIDLGMLRQTHITFLSDPDWAVHDLQIFWGASTMLAANVLLHWTFSDWRNLNPPPQQNFDPHDPRLTIKKWDYYTRISMLGWYGISQKLPRLPAWLAQRVVEQNHLYQTQVRRFIQRADLYRLTRQPLRSGEGERWAAFQYSLPAEEEHLLFVFRLPGGEAQRAIRLQALRAETLYRVAGLEGEYQAEFSGRHLMEAGLLFSALEEEESALLKITPQA